MRLAIAVSVALSGCINPALIRERQVTSTPDANKGPYLKLEVAGVNLDNMGLYLAPNILPALNPPFVGPPAPPAQPAEPEPTPTPAPATTRTSYQPMEDF